MPVRACVLWVQARVCVLARVASLIQHPALMRYFVYGLSGSTTFFDIISQTERFSEKKSD